MVADNELRPIIVKRKKVVAGHGHHGGAWKVAYADFVTAMMAFFLLMWLVSATTQTQRSGLADYFSPTVPLYEVSGGGDGAMSGDSPFANDEMPHDGAGATQEKTQDARQARGETGVDLDSERSKAEFDPAAIDEKLYGLGGESLEADELLKHIVTRVTDEGFVIDIHARPGHPLFLQGGAAPTETLSRIVTMISNVIDDTSNDIEVGAHLRSVPVVMAENPVWDLSSARADRVRLMLEGDGIPPVRMRRITGHADRTPIEANPMDLRNNRIEITLLRY
ncbi:MAG: chemotaxis protein MotB [Rhodobacteraceae bacterium]|nr:chemotaxis protein MotB [Paracoccaceae bacterium]